MRNEGHTASAADHSAPMGEHIIEAVTQGPLRRYGPEGHPGQEAFERVMKTLRRRGPDEYEPATPPPTYPLKPYTGPIEIANQ